MLQHKKQSKQSEKFANRNLRIIAMISKKKARENQKKKKKSKTRGNRAMQGSEPAIGLIEHGVGSVGSVGSVGRGRDWTFNASCDDWNTDRHVREDATYRSCCCCRCKSSVTWWWAAWWASGRS